MTSATRPLVGQIPEPRELYGRENLLDLLWQTIDGNNILLLAPRRFGKSGVMRHVLLNPRPNYFPIYFDLEDVDSPEEFVWRVTRELLSQDVFRKLLRGAKKLPSAFITWVSETFDEAEFEGAKVKFKAQVAENWREAAKQMLVEIEKADQTIIFIFDELPAMLDRIIEKHGAGIAGDFLAWFRTTRLEQKDVLRRHRFIVAGSVGIDQVLRKIGSTDKLVDFARLTVDPLDSVSADKLVNDLSLGLKVTWTPQLSKTFFELIGAPVPYFIHIFLWQVGQLPVDTRNNLSANDVQRVYRDSVLGPTCRQYFDHYSKRLRRYGPKGEKAALEMLRSVADRERISRLALYDVYKKCRGRSAACQEFDDIMADLENDWYLRLDADTNEFYFRLKVMRDWWRRWYPSSNLYKGKKKS